VRLRCLNKHAQIMLLSVDSEQPLIGCNEATVMIGSELHTAEGQAITVTRDAEAATPTGSKGLEVAVLRERMDGVTLKLAEIDERVSALEFAERDDVAPSTDVASEEATPVSEHSHGRATEVRAIRKGIVPPEPSQEQSAPSAAASPATPAAPTPVRSGMPAVGSPSIILMLTDGQFDRWLETDPSRPIDLARANLEEENRDGDWRQRKYTARPTRSGRR
jgi:hypothetical protein